MEEEHKTDAAAEANPEKRAYVHVTLERRMLLLVLTNDHAIRLS